MLYIKNNQVPTYNIFFGTCLKIEGVNFDHALKLNKNKINN
jgi:hypothetical protein